MWVVYWEQPHLIQAYIPAAGVVLSPNSIQLPLEVEVVEESIGPPQPSPPDSDTEDRINQFYNKGNQLVIG